MASVPRRQRSRLPRELREQLALVEPSRDGPLEYRPCVVVLSDGTRRDNVYVCEAEEWFKHWGVDPEDDRGKQSIPVDAVVGIEESALRLPARFANQMYAAGESAMGGCYFQLVLNDGRVLNCGTGNAVDCLDWPPGTGPDMVVELIPHAGRAEKDNRVRAASFSWCLYESQDG